ncbi:MAG TPA: hypothetical protein VM911_14660 [Pyrinomonadaceae bacterium]|jgi:hypothetical protein|nr:hypothetical protein [Pyrinomonadaceae bacterium]
MKNFKTLHTHIIVQAFILITCLSFSTSAQVETKVICKDAPLPQGYKIVQETPLSSCPGKKGVLIQKIAPHARAEIVLLPMPETRTAVKPQKIPVRTGNGPCQLNGGIPLNSIESKVSNIRFNLCLGKLSNGHCVTMGLYESAITPDIYTPYAFGLPSVDRGEVELINDTSHPPRQFGELHELVDGTAVLPHSKQPMRQIKLPERLIDVAVISPWEYDLRFYQAKDVGPKENGLYTITGSPEVVWKIKNPEPPSLKRFQLIRTKDDRDDVTEFTYEEAEDKWSMFQNGSWVTIKSSVVNPDNPCERIETRLDKEDGQVVKTIKTFRAFPWGEELVKTIEDPDGKALVTTFTYFEDKKGPHYRFLKSTTYPDGTVELENEQPDPTMSSQP